MKKIIIALLLLHAAAQCSTREPMPSPTISLSLLSSVQSFSGYLLQYLVLLLRQLSALPEYDRMQIFSTVAAESQKQNLLQNYDAYNRLTIDIIKAKDLQ